MWLIVVYVLNVLVAESIVIAIDEPVSEIDTIAMGGLKALDPNWPIREADIALASFNHLVGSLQQRRWDCESERLRSPVVDDQLEPRCLSQRQLTRPSAIQDFCDLLSRARINLSLGRAGT
jgi:hypothetical protein